MPRRPARRRRMLGIPRTPDEESVGDVLSRISNLKTTRPANPRDGDTWTQVVGNHLRLYHCRKIEGRLIIGYTPLQVG